MSLSVKCSMYCTPTVQSSCYINQYALETAIAKIMFNMFNILNYVLCCSKNVENTKMNGIKLNI